MTLDLGDQIIEAQLMKWFSKNELIKKNHVP